MASESDSLAIVGATLIDGSGAEPLADAALLIEAGHIRYAGSLAGFEAPAGVKTIDARGKFLVPGLIDLHVHSTFESDMRVYLDNGVTSIRYAGLNQDAVVALRQRVERGQVRGPRIFSCGPMLDATPSAFPRWTTEVNTPQEAADTAQRLLAEDQVEALIVTQRITPQLLRPIVEAAHEFGRPVTGQIWATDARQAAEIGIDQLDNNSRFFASREYPAERLLSYNSISERLGLLARGLASIDWDLTAPMMEAMLRHQVAYCPTLVVTQHRAGLGHELLEADPDFQHKYGAEEHAVWAAMAREVGGGWSAEDVDFLRRALETRQEWMRRFHALGGTLVLGTDMQFGGIMIHHELRNLAEAGLSLAQVIAAATGRSAQALRMADTLGTLHAGKQADLLLLNRDPLRDLGALRDIDLVIKGGIEHPASKSRQIGHA